MNILKKTGIVFLIFFGVSFAIWQYYHEYLLRNKWDFIGLAICLGFGVIGGLLVAFSEQITGGFH